LIGVGGLSLAVSGQAPGPSKKSIAATKIAKVKDNLYVITGSGAEDTSAFSGGNVAVFITDAGVTIVDAKLPGFRQDRGAGCRRLQGGSKVQGLRDEREACVRRREGEHGHRAQRDEEVVRTFRSATQQA
jgi:hypothetical protein